MQFLFHAIAGIRYTHDEFGPFGGNRITTGRAKYSGFDAIGINKPNGAHEEGGHCHQGSDHGTHVAALAGGKMYGVAKGATLYSVRVLNCNGKGTETDIINGLDHAVNEIELKRTSNQRRGIINMSLGENSFKLGKIVY